MTFKYILLDIEGTTTSISFVKDELFPYIRRKLASYLENNWDSPELQDDINLLRKQVEEDIVNNVVGVPRIENDDQEKSSIIHSVIANVNWLMDDDRKITALKQLQGHMWRQGYASGEILGHVYDDVEPALKVWTSSGQKVYIYSSGSVEAQKLLFGHSVAGNLLQYITGHFDTKIGLKIHQTSYDQICRSIGVDSDRILFLTDILAEAEAATGAGLRVKLMDRPGNAPFTPETADRYSIIRHFGEI